MLTLFHAPHSRSSRIIGLIHEMGIANKVDIRIVTIPRQDGSGGRDPANPHPEGKVPALLHDGTLITETAAIILYLTALFPESGMAPAPGTAARGEYLSWLFWYGSVMEPVMVFNAAGLEHPFLTATFRGVPELTARLATALANRPYLLGDSYSAADLLVHSPYAWFRDETPADPKISDWVDRCMARESRAITTAYDTQALAA
ncbi:glutathione S-transferase family protein [Fertoebacter nigrum]|uniref:Glutathione S-transferase family protein n=1 Tax=Fertoeibacter niger TaxID=2656921 RepID=A0A8X8H2P3_9RHOB|nr:glutathione S-transferase family protein [Fertoeibacter niger]NUB45194.1 glutathione S-transferase family protein [Fertoeibacter niger]